MSTEPAPRSDRMILEFERPIIDLEKKISELRGLSRGTVDFTSEIQSLDMYVIVDRSGSMSAEITTVRTNLSTVRNNLTCPPNGSGKPGT